MNFRKGETMILHRTVVSSFVPQSYGTTKANKTYRKRPATCNEEFTANLPPSPLALAWP